jgi:hypothetical protein
MLTCWRMILFLSILISILHPYSSFKYYYGVRYHPKASIPGILSDQAQTRSQSQFLHHPLTAKTIDSMTESIIETKPEETRLDITVDDTSDDDDDDSDGGMSIELDGDLTDIPFHSVFAPINRNSDPYLDQRTLTCLDFQYILDTLRNCTSTRLGAIIANRKESGTAEFINLQYAMVDQIAAQSGLVPIRSEMDVLGLLKSIEYNGSPPEVEELSYFADTLQQIADIKKFILEPQLQETESKLPLFEPLARSMNLPAEVEDLFDDAFDDENNLNAKKFPVLGQLRAERDKLNLRIIQILNNLLKSDTMREKLADSSYREINGRYCIMLRNTYKRGIGVVHGSSNTGQTVYVEPFDIVNLSNEYREIKVQIKVEENRILFEMVRTIANYMSEIQAALQAVAEVDVFQAKAKLGKMLSGVIPEVGEEGYLRVARGRHPVLLLRGVRPVENGIELSQSSSALVISGPNAGGKVGSYSLCLGYVRQLTGRDDGCRR